MTRTVLLSKPSFIVGYCFHASSQCWVNTILAKYLSVLVGLLNGTNHDMNGVCLSSSMPIRSISPRHQPMLREDGELSPTAFRINERVSTRCLDISRYYANLDLLW